MELFARIKNILQNKTAKNGMLYTFFAFCNNGISFILLLILAKFIEPGQYGQLNLFNTGVQLLSFIICLSSQGYVSVAFFKKKSDEFQKILNTIFIIATATLFVLSIVVALFSSNLSGAIGISDKYQWLALLVCYFQVYNNINLDIWRLEEKPVLYGLYSMSIVLFNCVLTLFFVISLRWGWEGRVYSQVSIACIYFFISLIFLIKRGYLTLQIPKKETFKEVLAFGVPLIPHQTAYWIRQGMDRYVINYFWATTFVGLYGFSSNFANIITIIGSAFNATNSVSIFKSLANGYLPNKRRLIKINRVMLLLFLVITLIIIGGCLLFIPILLPDYSGAINYSLPLCLSSLFTCYYMLYVNYLFFYSKTRQLMYITFSSAILQMILCILFARYNAVYAAWANALISMLVWLLVMYYSKHILKQQENIDIENGIR